METEKLSDHPTSEGSHKCVDKQNTIRFALELRESNDKYFPEFSFRELLRSAVPKVGETPEKEDPPFDDEDDEKLQALAKKFEGKYGTKQKSKKKRKERIEDLVDVTYGYDETDPFVDNSEAYDELIPSDWTTEHGGFYINQGGLSFKPTLSDDSDVEDFKGKKRRTPKKIRDPNKVRKVKDSGEKEKKRKHLTPSGEKEKKPHKIRLVSGDKEKKHKKKLNLSGSPNTATSPSTLAIKLIVTNAQAASSLIASTTTMAAVASPTGSTVSLASSLMSVGANLTPGPSTEGSPQSAEKSSVKMEASSESQVPLTKAVTSETSLFSSEGNSNNGVSNSTLAVNQNGLPASEGGGEDSTFVPKLPQYLPLSVEACVQKLKQAANDAVDEGKCKFFNKDVNQLLLEIETKSRELSCRVRSGIYDYLAFYLPCTKETLLKRAKKLLLTDQAGRLREPMAKLRAAVNKVMPEQIKAFEEEVRHHVEEQSKQNEAKPGTEIQSSDDKKELFKSAMEVEEDGEKVEEAVTPTEPMTLTPTEEKTKKLSPKRKFVWTDELRDLLSDVVTVKVKLFEMSKTRTTSAEEYLKEFFESEVKTLWPKGWMTSRNLFKESKSVHNRLTSAQFKPKKVPGPKKQGESSSPSDGLDSSSQNLDIKEEMKVAQTFMDTTPSTNTAAVTPSPTSNTLSEVKVATPVVPMAAATVEQIIGFAATTVPSSTHPAIKSLPKLSADALSMLKAKLIQVNYPGGSGKVTVLTQPGNKVVSATILTAKSTSAPSVSMGTITSKVPVSVGAISIKTPVSLATSKAKVPISIATITTKTPLSMAVTTKAQVSMVTTTSKPLVSVNRLDMESRGAVTKVENTIEKRPDHRAGTMTSNGLQQQIPVCMPGQLHRTSATALPDQRKPHTVSTAFPKAQYLSAAASVSRTSAPPTRTTMKNPVTILDFADMVCADSQSDTQEILNNQMQAQQFINKSMLTAKPKETPMTVPPKSPAAVVSPPRQQNPVYTGTSPSNIIRSPTQMIQQRNNMPQSSAALANMLMNCGMSTSGMPTQLQNKYIDLNTATMMAQQAQQRQQAANNKTMLDSISAQSRMSMDMHSPSVPLTHPVISRQLSNPTQSASVFLPSNIQQPTLSMLGHANLQGKGTNPLSHLGMVPQSVPSSVINMNRSIQQQSNLVMAQNPYNQDPNHNPNGGHPQSSFMPRFS